MRWLGTPAEERGGGKELMARNGAFDGVDAALMIHPAGVNLVTMPCLAIAELEATYIGVAAHASAMPERGVNALDALVIAYQAVGALRQHIRPTERLHGIITDGGQAPNIVPERAAGRFYVRAANAAELAALKTAGRGLLPRRAPTRPARGSSSPGATSTTSTSTPRGRSRAASRRTPRASAARFFPYDKLPPGVQGSTDMGNVSQRVPSIHPMIASAPLHVTIHNAEFAKWAASELGDQAVLDGAKALAMTALDFLCDAELRDEVARAFANRQRALATRQHAARARVPPRRAHDAATGVCRRRRTARARAAAMR